MSTSKTIQPFYKTRRWHGKCCIKHETAGLVINEGTYIIYKHHAANGKTIRKM